MKIRILMMLFMIPFVYCQNLRAQDKIAEKYSVSSWFGLRKTTRDIFSNTGNLDFLNYLDFESDEYLGFTTHACFNDKWEADVKLALYSDMIPTYLNAKGIYKPFRYLGFTVGIYIYPHYLNNYDSYHKLQDDGFYGDINTNTRQNLLNETGFIAGLVFPFSYHSFTCTLYFSGGISSMVKFEEVFDQKEVNSNLRRVIRYETLPSPALYFLPEAELKLDILKLKKSPEVSSFSQDGML